MLEPYRSLPWTDRVKAWTEILESNMTGRPEGRPEHSPLGASSAERWMNCPGSTALLDKFGMPETEEPDYRREGTAMHHAAAFCLEEGVDAWEVIDQTFNETKVDVEMSQAIQVYLDACRQDMDTALEWGIEAHVQLAINEMAYGTADWWAVWTDRLKVRDLKGGKGIIVEPEENPQLMYYAGGVIDEHPQWPDEMVVDLEIVQPRGFHHNGPIRSWATTVGYIRTWMLDVLRPAMLRTQMEKTFDAGSHCRFCPAKLVCPLLVGLFRAACVANPNEIVRYDDATLARSAKSAEALPFYVKALNDEVFKRLNAGKMKDNGVVKLVYKKANRTFPSQIAPDDARPEEYVSIEEAVRLEPWAADAFTPPALKSPAEMEKISAAAKAWVRQVAFTPESGLTTAPINDPRPAVTPSPSNREAFPDPATVE